MGLALFLQRGNASTPANALCYYRVGAKTVRHGNETLKSSRSLTMEQASLSIALSRWVKPGNDELGGAFRRNSRASHTNEDNDDP